MTDCRFHCLHEDITPDLIRKSREDEQLFRKKMQGYASHENRVWNEREDLIGSVAQTGAIECFKQMSGLESITPSIYYDDKKWGDQGDFQWRGQWNDIKGSPTVAAGVVYQNSRLLISHHQQTKEVDNYIFVKVDMMNMVLHIVGVISYHEFWDLNQVFQSPKMKAPCNFVYAKQLQSVRNWLYAV